MKDTMISEDLVLGRDRVHSLVYVKVLFPLILSSRRITGSKSLGSSGSILMVYSQVTEKKLLQLKKYTQHL